MLAGRGIESVLVGDQLLGLIDDEVRQAADALDRRADLDDPLAVAALALKLGRIDGVVGGATRPTADIVRAGLTILGVTPGASLVSGSFFFELADGTPVAYGDCGVVPEPDAEQLAHIAVATAATYADLTGDEPRVAMLSFSTNGSATGPWVDKVVVATDLVTKLAPDLAVDGELQFDAAFVPEVAARKAPKSAVAGRANVFIFPDLNSGNIAYKITERLAGARAYGPLLQGLNGVLHDLSRGCSAADIATIAAIAAVQAHARR